MKLFYFLVAAFLIGGSAAQSVNVTLDIQIDLNDFEASVNDFARNFVDSLRGAVDIARSFLEASWNALRLFLTSISNFTSPTFVRLIEAGINVTREAFNNDFAESLLRNATDLWIETTSDIYREVRQQYIEVYNASRDVYQCWNVSRPLIVQVLRDFISTTSEQSRPSIQDFRDVTSYELDVVVENITHYQMNVPRCWSLNLFKRRECKDAYVSFD